MRTDFAIMILTHGRADNVVTYKTLKRCGYTGRIIIVIDNEDSQAEKYRENYGSAVCMFDKAAAALRTEEGFHDHKDRRAIIYARNEAFRIARREGLRYFMTLDDDYSTFDYRFDEDLRYNQKPIKDLDSVLNAMIEFYEATPNVLAVALSQGGDFLGGRHGSDAKKVTAKRKCMNTFLCSTDRPFEFVGTHNEDVNTYVTLAQQGKLFFSFGQVSITQTATQSNPGGITEFYLKHGTYVKSFTSVMYSPSNVKVSMMASKHGRLHHSINWPKTAPRILREGYRKL